MTDKEEQILEKLAEKHEFIYDIIHEIKQYRKLKETGLVEGYIAFKGQLNDWDDQLTIDYTQTIERGEGELTETVVKGRVDLFADKDTKDFDRAIKYFKERLSLHKDLKAMWSEMTGEQQEFVEDDIRKKKLSISERIAI